MPNHPDHGSNPEAEHSALEQRVHTATLDLLLVRTGPSLSGLSKIKPNPGDIARSSQELRSAIDQLRAYERKTLGLSEDSRTLKEAEEAIAEPEE